MTQATHRERGSSPHHRPPIHPHQRERERDSTHHRLIHHITEREREGDSTHHRFICCPWQGAPPAPSCPARRLGSCPCACAGQGECLCWSGERGGRERRVGRGDRTRSREWMEIGRGRGGKRRIRKRGLVVKAVEVKHVAIKF